MELVLLRRVEKLGNLGDVVKVKRGFGVNYLLPQQLALRATKANLARFEAEKAQLEQLNLQHKEESEMLAKKIEDKIVVIIRQAGESGHLYGSVSAKDISEALNDTHINKSHVRIDHPIKEIGVHPVRVQLHPDVQANIFVNVAKSEDEAEAQAENAEETVAESSAERVE